MALNDVPRWEEMDGFELLHEMGHPCGDGIICIDKDHELVLRSVDDPPWGRNGRWKVPGEIRKVLTIVYKLNERLA